jgi:hypothetical protein
LVFTPDEFPCQRFSLAFSTGRIISYQLAAVRDTGCGLEPAAFPQKPSPQLAAAFWKRVLSRRFPLHFAFGGSLAPHLKADERAAAGILAERIVSSARAIGGFFAERVERYPLAVTPAGAEEKGGRLASASFGAV